jgi:hypothetical protein
MFTLPRPRISSCLPILFMSVYCPCLYMIPLKLFLPRHIWQNRFFSIYVTYIYCYVMHDCFFIRVLRSQYLGLVYFRATGSGTWLSRFPVISFVRIVLARCVFAIWRCEILLQFHINDYISPFSLHVLIFLILSVNACFTIISLPLLE